VTRLSNRQYPLMRLFIEQGPHFHMRIHEAQTKDQRPFRSMLIRKWIAFRPGKGFHLTRAGRDAWAEFQNTNIDRRNPSLPLTAYFDPTLFGLKDPYRKRAARVHEMPLSLSLMA